MRINTSGRALFGLVVTPLALAGLGAATVDADHTTGIAWLTGGAVCAVVAAADHPIRVWVNADGVHRRCLLRRHRIGWERVAAFELRRGRALCLVTTSGRRYLLGDRMDVASLAVAVARLCPSVVVRECQSPAGAGL